MSFINNIFISPVKSLFYYFYLGATEVIGVFSGFDLNSPVYSSEIQCPALGVDLRIFDNEGNLNVSKYVTDYQLHKCSESLRSINKTFFLSKRDFIHRFLKDSKIYISYAFDILI